jgi:hypothetical protein
MFRPCPRERREEMTQIRVKKDAIAGWKSG